jgi:hypothetical protein
MIEILVLSSFEYFGRLLPQEARAEGRAASGLRFATVLYRHDVS